MEQKGERACRICGCTDTAACQTEAGPCHWVEPRLCSAPACVIHARAISESDKPLLEKIARDQREALLAEGSYIDKAGKFEVAVGTIKSRINRGRQALAQLRRESLGAV